MTWAAVFVGGFIGAPLRFLIDWATPKRRIPLGILLANTLGCLLYGLASNHFAAPGWHTLLTTGFCGALTTFSTFSFDVMQAIEREQFFRAAANVVLSISLGYLAMSIGLNL